MVLHNRYWSSFSGENREPHRRQMTEPISVSSTASSYLLYSLFGFTVFLQIPYIYKILLIFNEEALGDIFISAQDLSLLYIEGSLLTELRESCMVSWIGPMSAVYMASTLVKYYISSIMIVMRTKLFCGDTIKIVTYVQSSI